MNRKQLTLLLVAGLLIGVAGLLVYNKRNSAWQVSGGGVGEKVVPNFPLNDVSQVHIQSKQGSVTLVKSNDLWRVQERGNYPANFDEIKEALQKIWELKATQTEQVGPSQLARLELETPDKAAGTGTLVEFKNESGKTLHSIILGKQQMRKGGEEEAASPFGGGGGGGGFPAGRWIKVAGASQNVALVSDPLSNLTPSPESWLDKEFIKIEKIKSIASSSKDAASHWKIVRETENGEWKLHESKPDEQLDNAKVASIPGALSNWTFTDVKPATTDAAQTGMDAPANVTIETFDGVTYALKIGKKDPAGNYFAKVTSKAELPKGRTPAADEKPEDKDRLDKEFADTHKQIQDKVEKEKTFAGWVYAVPSYTLDSLVKPRAEMLVKKESPTADAAPTPQPGDAPNAPAPAPKPAAPPADPKAEPKPGAPKAADAKPKPAPEPPPLPPEPPKK